MTIWQSCVHSQTLSKFHHTPIVSHSQTKRRLMDRFQAHMRNVTVNKVDDTIGRHFNLPGHRKIADMKIHILDFIHAHPKSSKGAYLRNTTEINWMHRLNTIEPRGLNLMDCWQD